MEKLLVIKGVESITIAGFLAEVGDIRRFDSPKQIPKVCGIGTGRKQFWKAERKNQNQQTGKKETQKDLVSGNDTITSKKQRVSGDL